MKHQQPGPRRLIARAVAVIALALGSAVGGIGSAAAMVPAQTSVILDTTAHPVLTWSVPNRYDASWAAYDSTSSQYDRNFVNPASWSMNLNACASTSEHAITGFRYTIAQPGTGWSRSIATTACQLNLRNVLPAQG